MRIDISTPDEVGVTISDKDGYSPDKLDDWVARAVQFVAVERQMRLHMCVMEQELLGSGSTEPSGEVSVELGEGDSTE